MLVEVVEHHLGLVAALDLDVDAHVVLVGLVAQLADALELLFLDQVGDLLDQPRLVHLVRDLGDDDRFAAVVGHLDRSEEHTSELQSLMRISYAVFCLKKKNQTLLTSTYTQLIFTL